MLDEHDIPFRLEKLDMELHKGVLRNVLIMF